MIVDDSFNYHSLSLTIMFAIKRSMIVHDSLSKSRNVLASLPRIFFDTEVIPSPTLNFKAVLFPVTCSTNMAGPRTHLLAYQTITPTSRCLFFFLDFSRFSHFLPFSVTVARIFVQIIALLFFTGRWQCGSHIALSPPWLPPLTEKLSCAIIFSVKRKKPSWKNISNLHMSKLHDSWW